MEFRSVSFGFGRKEGKKEARKEETHYRRPGYTWEERTEEGKEQQEEQEQQGGKDEKEGKDC